MRNVSLPKARTWRLPWSMCCHGFVCYCHRFLLCSGLKGFGGAQEGCYRVLSCIRPTQFLAGSIGWLLSIVFSPSHTVIGHRLSYYTLTNSPAAPPGVARKQAKSPLLAELSNQGHHRQESLLASSSD